MNGEIKINCKNTGMMYLYWFFVVSVLRLWSRLIFGGVRSQYIEVKLMFSVDFHNGHEDILYVVSANLEN